MSNIGRFESGTREKRPWDRLSGEPIRWYSRFDKYRLMGEQRSMVAVYRETSKGRSTKRNGTKSDSNVPGPWSKAAQEWNWKERAAAWDEAEIDRERREREQFIRRERESRIQMIVETRRMLSNELQQMVRDPAKLRESSLTSIVSALDTVFRLQREEFGETRNRIEVSGPGGGPMETVSQSKVDWNKVPLAAKVQILAAMPDDPEDEAE